MIGSFKVPFCPGGTELPSTDPKLDEEVPVDPEVPVEPDEPANDSGKKKAKSKRQKSRRLARPCKDLLIVLSVFCC